MIEKIYIPTFRRVDTQTALNNIPQKYKDKVVLVVQEQERKKYKYDVDYLVVGNNIGIANTRKIIYDNSKNIKFGMIDDDVIFYRRNSRYYDLEPNMEVSKRVMIDSDWDDMFDRILEYLDDEDVLMVGHREYTFPPIVDSKRKRGGISKNLGVFGAVWIDGKKLSTFVDDIEWSQFPICEDLVLNMETLLHGYGTVRMDEFAMKQYYNNHAPGGFKVTMVKAALASARTSRPPPSPLTLTPSPPSTQAQPKSATLGRGSGSPTAALVVASSQKKLSSAAAKLRSCMW